MRIRFCLLVGFSFCTLIGQEKLPAGLGRGWSGEFQVASSQLLALAEVTPAEKYAFRPAPGVRSTSEVFMHVAVGNYWLLAQAGIQPGGAHWPSKITWNEEKTVTAKAEVVKWLKDSFAAVRELEPRADRRKVVKFFGQQVPAEAVLLRLLVHNHEHMGQAIAYARINGVVPPWSASAEAR